MNETARLHQLYSYNILDTAPEKYLDELTEIASAICDTPISLLSLVDRDRQWFKANKGFPNSETPREQSFCRHAIGNSNDVLVVTDPLNDKRFKNNPLVTGENNIRFYAGSPLISKSGDVMGTLCVLDNKPREISGNQLRILKILAAHAMEYLETRKEMSLQETSIENSASKLKKLTMLAPGVIYQLELTPEGKLYFPFISEGIKKIHPTLEPEVLMQNAEIAYSVVHPEDLERVQQSLMASYRDLTLWDIEYRVSREEGENHWHRALATPEKKADGTVVWYGTFQDITPQKKHIKTLEQILFDISHVMRRPVSNMLGLTSALERDSLNEDSLRMYSSLFKNIAEEMDQYIHKLNEDYSEMQKYFIKKNEAKD